ncbi:MAG: hypothetical protein A07HR67_02405 [uncultured archaeon A07HR67]|nr:MAG: hypothetical protein A07HR67_02405 [uncultured archaeon A07HR67]
MIAFSDLATAAYCPRQLYYRRREDDRRLPATVRDRIDLAYRYPELAEASDATLERLPLRREPATYRHNLARLREHDAYERLVAPAETRVFLSGRDCHGIAHKLLAGVDDGPPIPVICSPGEPPEHGVWEPQSVRAVAAAKALAWERERSVPRAYVEYPAVGVVRGVRLTTRRKATYRRALRAVRAIDGPPARVDDGRCTTCAYRDRCGTTRRSLRSLLR